MNAAQGPRGAAIGVRGLRKSYGKTLVLDGVDLDVAAGNVFALLGPNGAGKTTIVHILTTLLRPDAGQASIGGFDLARQADEVRAVIALTGQFAAVDALLTGRENLVLMGRLRHLGTRAARQRAEQLLEQFDLTDAATKTLATYSGGMRRRLDLAMSLVGDPRVIFLDEPTTGMDPRSRRTTWQAVRDLAERGVTIFLTTQHLQEADELADTLAVLDHGTIIASGTPAELKAQAPGGHVRFHLPDAGALHAAQRALGAGTIDENALALDVPGDGTPAFLRVHLDRLERAGVAVDHLSIHSPDLDDVFLTLTATTTKASVR